MAAFLRKYATGTGANIAIPMVKAAVSDFAVGADWTPAAGDVKYSIDGAAQVNIATLPTYSNGDWIFTFSNAELTGKRISVRIVDSATKAVEDSGFNVETYGHASAQLVQDLSAAAYRADDRNGDPLIPLNTKNIIRLSKHGGVTYYAPATDDDEDRGDALLAAVAAADDGQVIVIPTAPHKLVSSIGANASNVILHTRDGAEVYTTAANLEVFNDAGSAGTVYRVTGEGYWRTVDSGLIELTGDLSGFDMHGRRFEAYGASQEVINSATGGRHRMTATERIYSEQYNALFPSPPDTGPRPYFELNAPVIEGGSWTIDGASDFPYDLVINADTIIGGTTVSNSGALALNENSHVVVKANLVYSQNTAQPAILGGGRGSVFNIGMIRGWVGSTGGVFNNTVIDSSDLALATVTLGAALVPIFHDVKLITKASETNSISAGTAQSATITGTLQYNKAVHANVTLSHETRGPLRPTTQSRTLDVTATGAAGIDWANVENPTTALGLSGTTVGTITTYTGNTPQTGDAYAVVSNVTHGNAALKTLVDTVDAVADAIKVKTDALPTDPADASDITGAFNTVNTTLATLAGYVDTEIAAIKAKTDGLTFTGANVNANMEQVDGQDASATGAVDFDDLGSGASGTGDGDTAVNHNTGGADVLAYKTSGGVGIDNAAVRAFLTSEYDAGIVTTVRGRTVTDTNGRWVAPLMLNEGIEYTIYFEKPGVFGPDTLEITV